MGKKVLTKKWYQSKAVWGGIIATALGILQLIDQNFGTHLANTQIVSVIISLAGALGIYGRVKADKRIK